jgi:hypothetical protein
MITDAFTRLRSQDPVGYMLEAVRRFGFEQLFSRYYGIYRAIVIDTKDPQKRGRCRVLVPALGHQDESDVPTDIYALPCSNGLSIGSNNIPHGVFFPPEVGDQVFVCFERGLAQNPIYMGGWWHDGAEGSAPEIRKEVPTVRGLRTVYGHEVLFDDANGNVTIVVGSGSGGQCASKITMSATTVTVASNGGAVVRLQEGDVEAQNKAGATLSLAGSSVTFATPNDGVRYEANSSNVQLVARGKVEISGTSISLKAPTVNLGAGPQFEPAVMGDTLARQFLLHTHVCAAPGSPTTPQTGQFPVITNGLSNGVKVSL